MIVFEKPFFTVKETSEMLGLTQKTVYALIQKEKINAVKIGGSIRVPKNLFVKN